MADPIKLPAGYEIDTGDSTPQAKPPAGYTLEQAPNTTPAGLLPAVAKGAKDVFEGVGSGVANSLTGTRDLANALYKKAGYKAIGMNDIPDVPAVLREAGTTPPDASTAFKVGKAGEQVGEFMVPGIDMGKIAEAANFGGKLGHVAEFGTRVLGEAANAGAHTAIQTHGDPEATKSAALAAGAFSAPFSGVNAALKMVKPTTLYAPEAFMPFIADRFAKSGRFDDIVGQAIDNNINISRSGLAKAQALHGAQTSARDLAIAKHGSDLVDTNTVYEPLRGLQDIAERFGETGVVNQINKRIAAVEKSHGAQPYVPPGTVTLPPVNPKATLTPAGMSRTINTPAIPAVPGKITVNEAQDLKNFGQSLASDMYARTTDSVGAQKIREELAHGFMKSIEEVVPEVKDMNRNLQNTKVIRDAIDSYITSNPSLVNMRTLVWAAVAPKSAGISLLALPRVRSALAVAAHSNTISNAGSTIGRLAGATDTQMAPEIPQMPVGVR